MVFVDHVAAGIILPSLFDVYQNMPAAAVGVLASVLPDITSIYRWKGRFSYLSHRSAGHTLVFAPLLSIIPVVLVYLACLVMGLPVKNTPVELYALSLLSYVIHIGMDTFTPFGTQIFYPLSDKKLSLDLLASLEPVTNSLSIILIVFFLVNRGFPHPLLIRGYLALYFIYVLFTLLRKSLKSRKLRRSLKSRYPEAVYFKTVPRLNWKWKGIGQTPSAYVVLSDVKGEDKCKLYPADVDLPDQIKATSSYKKFMSYARIPVALAGKDRFSLINLVFTPQTLRLNYDIDKSGGIVRQEITGLKIPDSGI